MTRTSFRLLPSDTASVYLYSIHACLILRTRIANVSSMVCYHRINGNVEGIIGYHKGWSKKTPVYIGRYALYHRVSINSNARTEHYNTRAVMSSFVLNR